MIRNHSLLMEMPVLQAEIEVKISVCVIFEMHLVKPNRASLFTTFVHLMVTKLFGNSVQTMVSARNLLVRKHLWHNIYGC